MQSSLNGLAYVVRRDSGTVPACAGAQARLTSPLDAASLWRPHAMPSTAAASKTIRFITPSCKAKCGPADECGPWPRADHSRARRVCWE